MKFSRSRKFYILFSFCIVTIIFFFFHWKTVTILDQDNKINRIFVIDNNSDDDESIVSRGESTNYDESESVPDSDEKCRLGKGQKTSDHCLNVFKGKGWSKWSRLWDNGGGRVLKYIKRIPVEQVPFPPSDDADDYDMEEEEEGDIAIIIVIIT